MDSLSSRLKDKYISEGLFTEESFNSNLNAFIDKGVMTNSKGASGEIIFSKYANMVLGIEPIMNVYLPTHRIPYYAPGHYTEVDSIFVHKTGLYVVEFKNYSARISGNIEDEEWTTVYSNGSIHTMKNPIKQLDIHVNRLREFISDRLPDIQLGTIFKTVVFSDSCEIDESVKYLATQCEYLRRARYTMATHEYVLTDDAMDAIIEQLQLYSDSSIDMKFIHTSLINGFIEERYRHFMSTLNI